MKGKAIGAIVALLVTAFAGLYLSGYITVLLLKLDVPVAWNTYLQYIKSIDLPQVKPYAGRIKAGGLLGFGFPTLLYLGLLYLIFKPKKQSMHGDARFATARRPGQERTCSSRPRLRSWVGKFNGSWSSSAASSS